MKNDLDKNMIENVDQEAQKDYFEKNGEPGYCGFAWVEVPVDRVIERDKIKAGEVRHRMNNQISDSERLEYADFVIENDGKQMLISQVKEIFFNLCSK